MTGRLTAEKMALIISWVDRYTVCSDTIPGLVVQAMRRLGEMDGAGVMKFLV